MLRNLNSPETPVAVTTEDLVIRRECGCGAAIEYQIPAGSPVGVVRFLENQERPECDACVERREMAEEATERRRLRRSRLEASGLPRTLQDLSWDSYEVNAKGAEQARAAARRWAEGRASKPGLMVHGPVGVGKTRLAATAAWEMLMRRDVRWVSMPELIIRLGASFTDSDRARAIKILTGKGALVLDDLDKIKPSAWVLSNVFTAIDSRYQSGAPLFVTSNLRPDELVRHFAGDGREAEERRMAAEAIVSRLMEHCVIGRIEGVDRRRV